MPSTSIIQFMIYSVTARQTHNSSVFHLWQRFPAVCSRLYNVDPRNSSHRNTSSYSKGLSLQHRVAFVMNELLSRLCSNYNPFQLFGAVDPLRHQNCQSKESSKRLMFNLLSSNSVALLCNLRSIHTIGFARNIFAYH